MIRAFARPYAKALMEIVPQLDKAQVMHDELTRFETARKTSPELAQLFSNPGVSAEQKGNITDAIAKRLELSPLAVRVLHVLVQNHRINQLEAVLAAWKAMMNTQLGVEIADVRSAHPLSEEEKTRLRTALEKKIGKKIELNVQTDPTLLAGFVARVGSEIYDASVVGQIQRFQTSIR